MIKNPLENGLLVKKKSIMALIRILQYPDPRLRTKGTAVTDFGPKFQQIVDDMFETHYASSNCAALAATQLDIIHPPHVTVIDFSAQHNEPLCLVNAKIVHKEGETNQEEGCMSVLKAYEKVNRAEKISVQSVDRFGKPQNFEADDFLAKCIQHELDHLSGVLFIDYLSSMKRDRIRKNIERKKRRA